MDDVKKIEIEYCQTLYELHFWVDGRGNAHVRLHIDQPGWSNICYSSWVEVVCKLAIAAGVRKEFECANEYNNFCSALLRLCDLDVFCNAVTYDKVELMAIA